MKSILGIALLTLVFASSLPAEEHPWIEQGVQHYRQGMESADRSTRLDHFRQAERLFERAREEHGERVSADFEVNLGNAALQAERLGPAILAYRRALLLDPNHDVAHTNLDHARSLLPGWIPKPGSRSVVDTFFFWHYDLSRSEKETAGALCFAVAAILLALGLRLRKPGLRTTAVLPAIAWLALMGSWLVDPARAAASEAVVITPEVRARAADSPTAPPRFPEPLVAGTEVTVLDTRAEWLRVGLANGRDAWLPASAVERLGGQ